MEFYLHTLAAAFAISILFLLSNVLWNSSYITLKQVLSELDIIAFEIITDPIIILAAIK